MNDTEDWRARAHCANTYPDAFFPDSKAGFYSGDGLTALQLCRACPVQQQCLEFALSTNQEFGIWGGTSEEQRRRMRRNQGRDGGIPHGTVKRALHGCGCERCSEAFGLYEDSLITARRAAAAADDDLEERAQ